MIEKILIVLYSIILLFINEFIRKKYNLDEKNKKIKEIYNKYSKEKKEEYLLEMSKYQLELMRISLKSMIFSLLIFFILIFSMSPYEKIENLNNVTYIHIGNPILKNSYFAIENNGYVILKANDGYIEYNGTVKKVSLVVYEFPYNIPILNRNYLSIIGGFILTYLLIYLVYVIVKKLNKKFGLFSRRA